MKKKDLLLIAIVLCIAGAFWLGRNLLSKDGDEMVRVTIDGETYGEYPLTENQTIKINDTNVLVIEGGSADVTEANCPDHLCVHQKAISKDGESIICLPNKVVVEVQSDEQSTYDAVTN